MFASFRTFSRGIVFTVVLTSILLSATASATGQAHLTFHMGTGANNQFFVGGTVENQGDAPITLAYVSVLPISDQCELLPMAWQVFGPIPPHGKTEFRVPVPSNLVQYRLAGFAAFDDMGFALPAIDDTASIVKAREFEERKTCQTKRQ